MKRRFFSCILFIFFIGATTFAQTKLDTILMNLPAQSTAEVELYMNQLVDLGSSSIVKMAQRLKGHLPGKFDLKEHLALSGLAKYAGSYNDAELKRMVEDGFLEALQGDLDLETQVFLIEQLRYVASDLSIKVLEGKVLSLCEPAIQVIASISSTMAEKSLIRSLSESQGYCRLVVAKALGKFPSAEAVSAVSGLVADHDAGIRQVALESMASSGNPVGYNVLLALAKSDPAVGNPLLLKNVMIQAQAGNSSRIAELTDHINKTGNVQQKAKCIELLMLYQEPKEQKNLQKILSKGSLEEGLAITKALSENQSIPLEPYFRYFEKVPARVQMGLLAAAAERSYDPAIATARSLLSSSDLLLKSEAIRTLSQLAKRGSLPDLQKVIMSAQNNPIIHTAIAELGRWVSEDNMDILVKMLNEAPEENKASLIDLVADRAISSLLPEMEKYLLSPNIKTRQAAFRALPALASGATVNDLMPYISIAESPEELGFIQEAFKVKASEFEDKDSMLIPLFNTFGESSPALLSKILPAVGGRASLNYIKEKNIQGALWDWKHPEVLPDLFALFDSNEVERKKFQVILDLIHHPALTVDQKVLYLRKLMPHAVSLEERKSVIQSLGNSRTYTAFMYLQNLLKDDSLQMAAAKALVNVALPASGEQLGLVGSEVKLALMRADTILAANNDGYTTSILRRYISIVPEEGGYKSLFNGMNLDGWQGLVENPMVRDTLFAIDLKTKQIEADAKLAQNWKVEDGKIVFFGEGYDNLCTVESYRDFELLVDWKITRNGDSGIYLRGSPQVQIWDTSMTEIGAEVGSGGLYNNQEYESKPLTVADNAVGEWNTFRIIMIDDKVTVFLNGILVTDNVVLENYWNRALPIFRSGPIELQAHGTNLQFRDIYIREIESAPELSEREKSEGFKTIFNGVNLEGWIGNKTDYIVKDGEIVIYPGGSGGHGNLYTEKEYDNFILRFEFRLTPGANNGLGIHAPLEGDAAYLGKEIQILDNSSPIYKDLKDYQYHGSVYGLVPAEKGALKPVGEWNTEEVRVKGNQIWVIVNNKRILFDDLDNATRNGTLDGKEHPGLKRLKGHIGFLGHGSEVHFRNIRIKEEH